MSSGAFSTSQVSVATPTPQTPALGPGDMEEWAGEGTDRALMGMHGQSLGTGQGVLPGS